MGHIQLLEGVQRADTKQIRGMRHLSYWDRLKGVAVLTPAKKGQVPAYLHVQDLGRADYRYQVTGT